MKKLWLTGASFIVLIAGPAMAADMPVKAMPLPPPVPVYSWTGFYVGLNAGGTWTTNDPVTTASTLVANFTAPGPPPATVYGPNAALGANGVVPVGNGGRFSGGGQLGYNWQFSSAGIAGFEADIQGIAGGSNRGNLATVVGPFNFVGAPEVTMTSISSSKQLTYLGTVRGRLGVLTTPSFLLYGTGGLAYGGVKVSTAISQSNNDCTVFPGSCIQTTAATARSVSDTRVGWTAAGGRVDAVA